MKRCRWKSFFNNPKPVVSNVEPSVIQNSKWLGLSIIAFVLVVAGAVAQAQQPAKVHRIGFLSGGVFGSSSDIEAFRQGLRDLGYVEGKNLVIEYRYTERKPDRYPDLLSDLVRLKVDVIIGDGTQATIAAKKATSTIPIVMTSTTDPVGNGVRRAWLGPVKTSQDCQTLAESWVENSWSYSRKSIRGTPAWRS